MHEHHANHTSFIVYVFHLLPCLQNIISTYGESETIAPMVMEMVRSWHKAAPRNCDKVGLLTTDIWGPVY